MPGLSWLNTLGECGVLCLSFTDDTSDPIIAHAYFLLFSKTCELGFPAHVPSPVFFLGQSHSGWQGGKGEGEGCHQGK